MTSSDVSGRRIRSSDWRSYRAKFLERVYRSVVAVGPIPFLGSQVLSLASSCPSLVRFSLLDCLILNAIGDREMQLHRINDAQQLWKTGILKSTFKTFRFSIPSRFSCGFGTLVILFSMALGVLKIRVNFHRLTVRFDLLLSDFGWNWIEMGISNSSWIHCWRLWRHTLSDGNNS